jgi:sugar phosphate permease
MFRQARPYRDTALKRYKTIVFLIIVFASLVLATRYQFDTTTFVIFLLAFYGAQVSFVPILLRGFLKARPEPLHPVGGVLALLGGTIASLGCAIAGWMNVNEYVGWLGVPVSLAISWVVIAITPRIQARKLEHS